MARKRKSRIDEYSHSDMFEGRGESELPPIPTLGRGLDKISRDVFDEGVDLANEYEQIKGALSIKDALDPMSVLTAKNQTEEMARRAARLVAVAKVEFAKFERHTDELVAAMENRAIDNLELLKAEGKRTKQITNDDVKREAKRLFPDETEDVADRKSRAKRLTEYIERLSDLATARGRTLSRMERDRT